MTWPAGDPLLKPVQRSRVSLRVRLIALVVLVTLVALTVVDIVLPVIVRKAVLANRDQSLSVMLHSVADGASVEYLQRLPIASQLRTSVGLSLVFPDDRTRQLIAPANGDTGPQLAFDVGTDPVTANGDDGVSYRMLAMLVDPRDIGSPLLVIWGSLDDVDDLIGRLILTELLITTGLLILLGAAASLLIRRELRPLERMAGVADAIAGGDLTQRVPVHESGVEVDRLGVAFNGMLDGIGALLAERHAAEHRLRQFVADASHELRTPVAAVRGYTDLYAAGALPEPPAVGRAMERMGFESRRMGALVEDLLTLVQADTQGALVLETVDLGQLLRGAVDDAAAIDPARTWQLTGVAEPGMFLARGDGNRLHQLFANLLGNIRTHTPPGTAATVSVEPDVDPRFVAVTIADDGQGVDDAALPYLFDRFYRADPSRSRQAGGSGLGLAIVAAIANAHGGTVTAAHAAGGGLAVRVRLPRA